MFTGLVEQIGIIKNIRPKSHGLILAVDLGKLYQEVKLGDSVAVNGVCLSVTKLNANSAEFDVSGETLEKSTISSLKIGAKVNLELAIKADGRFGGHIVQGHVDGVAKLKSVKQHGDFLDVSFTANKDIIDALVIKGSVCVNGVSLTVAKLSKSDFTIAIIPVTWQETNLSMLRIGDSVNIETDIIVKTIKNQLENMIGSKEGLTIDKLKSLGF